MFFQNQRPTQAAVPVITSIAALLVIAGPAAAEVDLYGKINLTLQNSDEAGQSAVELQSNASRVGVKGREELDEAFTITYEFEWEVDPDGKSGNDNLSARNQSVGLTGGFGAVKLGRYDTALKKAQGNFDLFNDLEGDIKKTFNGENRLRNYVGYATPEFAEAFNITVNLFPGEDSAAGHDDIADGSSISLNFQADVLYLAIARDTDVDGEGIDTTRLVGGYTLGAARLGLLYQKTEGVDTDGDGFGASAAYDFGANTVKLQYLKADVWRLDPQVDPIDNLLTSQMSVGLDRNLGEKTKVFGFYTRGDVGGTNQQNNYVAIGIEHKF